jgi:hypothetical protein
VTAGDYRAALGAAIEARESAYAAARRAGDEKAAARSEAEQLLVAVNVQVATLEERLGRGAASRPSPAAAAKLRAALKTGDIAVQKARSLLAAQDYRGTVTLLAPIREAMARDLAMPATAAGRRGR